MERNHMTEEEAHRYLQKTSMDSGTNLVETAQMLLDVDGSINLGMCFRMKKLCKMETYADGNGDSMKFTKMHGIGNDYVYVNCFTEQVRDPEHGILPDQ